MHHSMSIFVTKSIPFSKTPRSEAKLLAKVLRNAFSICVKGLARWLQSKLLGPMSCRLYQIMSNSTHCSKLRLVHANRLARAYPHSFTCALCPSKSSLGHWSRAHLILVLYTLNGNQKYQPRSEYLVRSIQQMKSEKLSSKRTSIRESKR